MVIKPQLARVPDGTRIGDQAGTLAILLGLLSLWSAKNFTRSRSKVWLVSAVAGQFGIATVAWLLRQPKRQIPQNPQAVLAPADGVISLYVPQTPSRFLLADAQRIDIHAPWHVTQTQRAPLSGTVAYRCHEPQTDQTADSQWLGLEDKDGFRVLVHVVGGNIWRTIPIHAAHHTRCWAELEDKALAGQETGYSLLRSRAEVYLPSNATVVVTPGQVVRAGETILALRPVTNNC